MISGQYRQIPSLRRLDYTVIGDVVNTAERLHQAADEGQIVIAESSYEKIKQSFRCVRLNEVQLKHKAKPVQIYEVIS
jgi:class 3 adenylate cyclase